ncbi:MAG TPA: hypothetical protein VGB85_08530 [Nannocystis sp.]
MKQLRREYELDICEPCAVNTDPVVASRLALGDRISTRQWTTRVRTGNTTQTFHHMAIDVVPHAPLRVTATFTREGMWAKLKKLFFREVEVGDPMFDDFVHVGTRDAEGTLALLGHSGVQSVLMSILADHEQVTFNDGAFEVYDQSIEEVYPGTALLAVCALLVHIEHIRSSRDIQS